MTSDTSADIGDRAKETATETAVGDEAAAPVRARRLWKRDVPFAIGAVTLATLVIWGIGQFGWAVRQPFWLVAVVLLFAVVASFLSDQWQRGMGLMRFHGRVALKASVVAVCMYLTGWGPTLAIGLFYVIGDTLTNFGASAGIVAISWSLVAVGAGTLGVGLGWIPTEIHRPAVYGITALGAAALVALGMYMRTLEIRKERMQEVLQEEQDRFSALVQHSSDVIVVVDREGVVTYASPSASVIDAAGDRKGLALGQRIDGSLHSDDLPEMFDTMTQLLSKPGAMQQGEIRVRTVDGSWRWMEFVASNLTEVPGVEGIVVNGRDVTERKATELDLVDRATHDPLTGLVNRSHLFERLDRAMGRKDQAGVAVLYVDLDHFKDVNDTHGHDAGDNVLVTVVGRLHMCVRPQDTVARLGGDEFCIVLESPAGLDLAELERRASIVSERVISACTEPIVLPGGIPVIVSASIGIVVGAESQTSDEIIHRADIAMYQAKAQGRNRYVMA